MYQVPHYIDNNKVFIVQRSEIEGRLEPEFYRPSIADLEKIIRGKSSHKLRDYALSVSGGATPKKTEGDKYYADKETGVPFLRVQNLNTDGTLSFDDCLYINKETHEGMLARSQVSEGDLLVKITGVGRMAIASVAPEGFIGNTNQHMVVVKTGNKEISKYLARYLNLDIIEKIASRHSTGGTRPALDYPSVKNLPIIEGIDFSPIDRAIELKKQKRSEAKQLLDSIAPYLLNELGIILPNENYGLEKRIFYISSSECVDKRIDPKKYSPKTKDLYLAIENSSYPKYSLVSFIVDSCSGDWGSDGEVDIVPSGWTKCVVLRGTEIDNMYNLSICQEKVKKRLIQTDKFKKIQPLLNDIIIEKSGGSDDQPVGRVAIVDLENFNNIPLSFSNFLMKIRVKGIDANYLYYYLKTIYNIGGTDSMQSQTNGIRNLIIKEYLEQKVVVPSLEKQQEISNHIAEMRLMAKRLQEEGESILENAKKEVEQMILG